MDTILVIDDDELFRSITRHHLEAMGYQVVEHDSGIGITKLIAHYWPVACLIDIVMDGKEGIETIMEISALPDRPKIIAVSGNPEYLALVGDLGADLTLVKPVSPDNLRQALVKLGLAPA